MPTRAAPLAPAAPLERLAPPRIEREIATPAQVPPHEVPLAPAAPLERSAPPRIERELAPPAALSAPQAEHPTAPVAPSAGTPRQAPPRAGPSAVDEDIFKARRDVGAPPAESPHIDLDAARKKAAREIVNEGAGSRGVFTVPPPPPQERKSKEANALEKAIKPDCRSAYANLGLLAVPVLVASAIAADGTCRW